MVAVEPLCLYECLYRLEKHSFSVWAGLPLPFSSEILLRESAGTGHVDLVTPLACVVRGERSFTGVSYMFSL